MREEKAFTLIELMIVIAIIAIIASIAVPNLLSARLNANENAAIATLRNLMTVQTQFQCTAKADANGDGTGEFGDFLELSGQGFVRKDPLGRKLVPAVLSGGFRGVTPNGLVARSGYYFMILLPGPAGEGVLLDEASEPASSVDARLSASLWCCYAWPENFATSGRRTFLINQTGDIIFTDVAAYSGGETIPMTPGAGFLPPGGGETNLINGLLAVGTRGTDGNRWKSVD